MTSRHTAKASANRQERQEKLRATRAANRRRRNNLIAAGVAVLGVAIALIWVARPWQSEPADSNATLTVAEKVAVASGICQAVEPSQPNNQNFDAPPAATLGGPVTFTFETNCGPFVVASDADASPITTASMAFLAESGYFDYTSCHRLTTAGIFVVQCGDPLGTGTGGPGYQFADENLPEPIENNYPAGTLAMANAGPGTNGSQFFIVYRDTSLPPAYTIWGSVIEGLDMIEAVAARGTTSGATDGPLAQSLQIQSVQVN
jgi:peptidyl-prolyl cis-trans isomerase B (cyclophilin B)